MLALLMRRMLMRRGPRPVNLRLRVSSPRKPNNWQSREIASSVSRGASNCLITICTTPSRISPGPLRRATTTCPSSRSTSTTEISGPLMQSEMLMNLRCTTSEPSRSQMRILEMPLVTSFTLSRWSSRPRRRPCPGLISSCECTSPRSTGS